MNLTFMTSAIIALCVIIHLAQDQLFETYKIGFLSAAFYPKLLHAALDGYVLPYPLLTWLSPLSHGFMHGDWSHLAINMFFMLAIGTGLERIIGPWRFLTFFLVLTVLSTIGPILVYWIEGGSGTYVGASGALSGLLATLFRFRPKGGLAGLLVFIGINVGIALIGSHSDGFLSQIAWEGHISGAIAGYILAPLAFGRSLFFRPSAQAKS